MFVCLFFLYCYRFVKFCGKNFVTFCKMGATRPPKILLVFFFLKKKKNISRLLFLVYFCWTLKKKSSASSVCVNTFPFFVLGGVFCSFPSLSPLFVLNQSGTTTKKGKTRKRRKKKRRTSWQYFSHLFISPALDFRPPLPR